MPNKRRRMTGTVVSNKMQKTVVVRVDRSYRHPLYGKVVRDSRKFMAHDEKGECQMGDLVTIVESRPLSRHKRWVVQSVLREDAAARTAEVAELASAPVFEETPPVEDAFTAEAEPPAES